ncbi:MAG: NADH-quinone oxidoreductase subunit H [Anaerolineales bacterium]|nr:NADH-quinone oxidoreductase subunit H [Anaerolineales bacterium]
MLVDILINVIKGVVILIGLLTGFAYMTWIERRFVARIQVRLGPNRAGPFGLLQPVADGIKLLFKEEVIPEEIDKPVYNLAPALSMIVAVIAFAVIPVGDTITLFGRTIPLHLADVNIAILYVLGVSSLAVYGVVLGGWASNSKYALLGGLRASAQMISYELALGVSLVGVLMLAGSLSLVDIVEAQRGVWFVFLQPLGFMVFWIAAIAETNRAPFDLPEAEQELTAGYHVEYSGLRFALYFMAEYIHMITVSAIATTLFLGGWRGPFMSETLGPLWFSVKVLILLVTFVWFRGTFPRVRYDRLMSLGWKVLLPLAFANVMVTAVALVLKDAFF